MYRPLFAILGALFVLSVALAACSPHSQDQLETDAAPTDPPPTATSSPTSAPDPTETVPDYEIITLLPRDGIPAIFDPEFLTAEEANKEYNDNELVLGVEIDGDARAYSIPHLSSHEIVNDTVGGRHIAATWWPLCFTGIVYARDVDNHPEPLTFGVSGKLIMNVLVMYDRQTESYWSQILGQAVEGELTGTELTPIASLQTTWAQWRKLHPETLALRKGYSSANDPYINYYASSQAGVIGESSEDSRLNTKAMGIGFVVNDQPAFFPISAIREETVANDEIAGEPLLVIYRPEASTGFAFSRKVDDRTLTFSVEETENGDESTPNLIDAETGSRWSVFNGVAIDGPLAGKTLERIPSTTSFWFGWKDFHPDSYVYGVDESEGG